MQSKLQVGRMHQHQQCHAIKRWNLQPFVKTPAIVIEGQKMMTRRRRSTGQKEDLVSGFAHLNHEQALATILLLPSFRGSFWDFLWAFKCFVRIYVALIVAIGEAIWSSRRTLDLPQVNQPRPTTIFQKENASFSKTTNDLNHSTTPPPCHKILQNVISVSTTTSPFQRWNSRLLPTYFFWYHCPCCRAVHLVSFYTLQTIMAQTGTPISWCGIRRQCLYQQTSFQMMP